MNAMKTLIIVTATLHVRILLDPSLVIVKLVTQEMAVVAQVSVL